MQKVCSIKNTLIQIIVGGEIMKVLLVEDNLSIAKGLIYAFKQNEFEVNHAQNIKEAENMLKAEKYSIIILDIMLPDGNGFELYEKIKQDYFTPCIFLTARDDEDDIVKGLELGAEDYVTKPFSTRELIARMNKILLKGKNNKIKVKDITLDLDKLVVYKNDQIINLTALEIKLLTLLFTNIGKVIKREYIIEKIWDWTRNDVNDNTVSVYIKRIREKLDSDIIVTIKGIGYRVD